MVQLIVILKMNILTTLSPVEVICGQKVLTIRKRIYPVSDQFCCHIPVCKHSNYDRNIKNMNMRNAVHNDDGRTKY